MIYDFYCDRCQLEKELVQSIKEYDGLCHCDNCADPMRRIFTPTQLIGTSVQSPEFNPGLGMVTRSKKHAKDEARARGLELVGNDFGGGAKMDESFAKDREKKLNKAYDF